MRSALDEPAGRLQDDLARRLRTEPSVRLAYLFGSWARGAARSDSDVDVAVLVDDGCVATPTAVKETIWRLVPAMAGDIRSDRIDLVLLNEAPALLRHRVIRDGVLLTARNDAERARFVRRTIREYQDIEPRLREFTRSRIRRLKEERDGDGRYGDLLEAARRARRLRAAPAAARPDE